MHFYFREERVNAGSDHRRAKRFRIKERPYPKPGEGEVTLDVRACCVCGTDIHLLDGEFKGSVYPLVPGHEFSGVVREVGSRVTHVKREMRGSGTIYLMRVLLLL